eukprot:11883135-Karenia_brevis.AAC.1
MTLVKSTFIKSALSSTYDLMVKNSHCCTLQEINDINMVVVFHISAAIDHEQLASDKHNADNAEKQAKKVEEENRQQRLFADFVAEYPQAALC